MRDFHCRDLDVNCDFVARGDATEEVLEQTEQHVKDVHKMALTSGMVEKLKWLIHDRTSSTHLDSVQRSS